MARFGLLDRGKQINYGARTKCEWKYKLINKPAKRPPSPSLPNCFFSRPFSTTPRDWNKLCCVQIFNHFFSFFFQTLAPFSLYTCTVNRRKNVDQNSALLGLAVGSCMTIRLVSEIESLDEVCIYSKPDRFPGTTTTTTKSLFGSQCRRNPNFYFLKSPHHILKKLTLSSCLGLAQSTQGPKWKQNAQFCLPISL